MPSNAAIFAILVAGFIFIGLFDLTRYLAQSWNGPRLVFAAGAFGMVLLIIAKASQELLVDVGWLQASLEWLSGAASAEAQPAIPEHVILAVLLGVLVPVVLNLLTPAPWLVRLSRMRDNQLLLFLGHEFDTSARSINKATRAHKWADRAKWLRDKLAREQGLRRWLSRGIARVGARASRTALLAAKAANVRLIQITTTEDKVYVGYVISRPSGRADEKYFKFLPVLSGYRRKETRETVFTTNYHSLLERARSDLEYPFDPEDLQLVLPFERVVSARVFDPDAYVEHFEGDLPPDRLFEDETSGEES